ncbi:hypothetical protein C8Q76DRAFT_860360 [Earliella scabrosa]|nr:hypothetical protein C8Q76DRAFT_860360 [Earliella scabrosa]
MADDSHTSQLVDIAQSILLQNYFSAAAVVLIFYEYAITFNKEVELFWRRKITLASVLFLVNRYVPLAVNVLYSPYPGAPSTHQCVEGCAALLYIAEMLSIFQYLPWALTIITRTCLITCDLLVIGITWKATFALNRELKGIAISRMGFSGVLFRDGVIYFIVLLILNVLHLTFSLLSSSDFEKKRSSLFTLLEPMNAILISRFLLNLQEANNAFYHHSSSSTIDNIRFNRVLGSLGSSLQPTTIGDEILELTSFPPTEGRPDGVEQSRTS